MSPAIRRMDAERYSSSPLDCESQERVHAVQCAEQIMGEIVNGFSGSGACKPFLVAFACTRRGKGPSRASHRSLVGFGPSWNAFVTRGQAEFALPDGP